MDCFDRVEELLLAEGYTKEEIPEIMISLIEQGFDPTSVFLGGVANMLGFLPKKKKIEPRPAEPLPSEKIKGQGKLLTKTGKAQNFTGGRVPFTGTDPVPAASSKLPQPTKPPATSPGQLKLNLNPAAKPVIIPTSKDIPSYRPNQSAPKPEFGSNAVKPQNPVKSELRPGGQTPRPQFSVNTSQKPITPRRNNLSLQRTNLRAPSIPKPPSVPAPTGIFGRLKSIRGTTPAQLALNLAAGEALDRYVTQPIAKAGGDALARGILDATGKGEKARQINPQLYGKSGPNLTPEIVQGIRSREPRGQNLPPSAGDKKYNPDFGKPADPKTWKNATKPAPKPVAAKPAPKPVAAKPEPVKQTGDKAKDESIWRSANTRLSRVANMRKSGASREEINKVLYNKGTKAYGAK